MDRTIKPTDESLDKIFKLLPADVTAAFLGVRSIIEVVSTSTTTQDISGYVLFTIIILLTAITPFFLKAMDIISNGSQRLFLAGTFLIWAINIDYTRMLTIAPNGTGIFLAYLIPILLILWASLALPVYLHKAGS